MEDNMQALMGTRLKSQVSCHADVGLGPNTQNGFGLWQGAPKGPPPMQMSLYLSINIRLGRVGDIPRVLGCPVDSRPVVLHVDSCPT